MMGLSISLISHFPAKLLYMTTLIIVIVLLAIFLKKSKAIGEGDISTINWLFFGFGIINRYYLLWWVIYFIIITIAYNILRRIFAKMFKQSATKAQPFYPVLLISYVLCCFLFGLY